MKQQKVKGLLNIGFWLFGNRKRPTTWRESARTTFCIVGKNYKRISQKKGKYIDGITQAWITQKDQFGILRLLNPKDISITVRVTTPTDRIPPIQIWNLKIFSKWCIIIMFTCTFVDMLDKPIDFEPNNTLLWMRAVSQVERTRFCRFSFYLSIRWNAINIISNNTGPSFTFRFTYGANPQVPKIESRT